MMEVTQPLSKACPNCKGRGALPGSGKCPRCGAPDGSKVPAIRSRHPRMCPRTASGCWAADAHSSMYSATKASNSSREVQFFFSLLDAESSQAIGGTSQYFLFSLAIQRYEA